jgi:hypothetical protein
MEMSNGIDPMTTPPTGPRENAMNEQASIEHEDCLCAISLSVEQIHALKSGSSVVCPRCKRLYWVEHGALQVRTPQECKI